MKAKFSKGFKYDILVVQGSHINKEASKQFSINRVVDKQLTDKERVESALES